MVVAAIAEITQEKCVVIGAGGMLGHALNRVFPCAFHCGHKDLDITDPDMIFRMVRKISPRIIINAAAYTDVDGCEDNCAFAEAVNGRGPEYLAQACAECGAVLVHFSSDYVFDGSKKEYRETDDPCPLNRYGVSKLMGERNIIKNLENFRIIRTSWLFGAHGINFVDTVLELSKKQQSVKIVNDQIGKPTYTIDLAKKTREVITREPGIYHITNDGQCSWYEFARTFIPNAVPCMTAEFPRRAKRPVFSVLVNTKTSPMRHWKDAVSEYIRGIGAYP
jgi:dTDP-4-dehydrorhamnose reductase